MNFRFIIDLAFFIATLTSVTMGSRALVLNLCQFVEKETLKTVQMGLPKMEPFARRLTRWKMSSDKMKK